MDLKLEKNKDILESGNDHIDFDDINRKANIVPPKPFDV